MTGRTFKFKSTLNDLFMYFVGNLKESDTKIFYSLQNIIRILYIILCYNQSLLKDGSQKFNR